MWRNRRWRRLQNLIDRLPPDTFYRSALMKDPDYIREVMDYAGDDEREYEPPGELYSPVAERIDTLIDEIRMMRTEAISIQGGNPGRPKFQPRPKTAWAEISEQQSRDTYEWLHEQLIGGRTEQ